MVCELAKQIETFSGEVSLTRCFLHIVNLVAKTTIRVFDVPKKDADTTDDSNDRDPTLDDAQLELEKLAQAIEVEDAEVTAAEVQMENEREGDGAKGEVDEGDIENSTEGWIDEHSEMSDAERKDLDASVLPIHLAIAKVSHINLTTV